MFRKLGYPTIILKEKCSLDEESTIGGHPIIGKAYFANGECLYYADPQEYINAVRTYLPYMATSGFRFETLTEMPFVRKAVDDMIFNLYGEENPRALEEYESIAPAMRLE